MEVSISQLRDELSERVARARDGEEVTITNRGKPVARLVPVPGESNFDRLVREGVITPARSKKRPTAKPTYIPGVRLSEFVDEGRGPR